MPSSQYFNIPQLSYTAGASSSSCMNLPLAPLSQFPLPPQRPSLSANVRFLSACLFLIGMHRLGRKSEGKSVRSLYPMAFSWVTGARLYDNALDGRMQEVGGFEMETNSRITQAQPGASCLHLIFNPLTATPMHPTNANTYTQISGTTTTPNSGLSSVDPGATSYARVCFSTHLSRRERRSRRGASRPVTCEFIFIIFALEWGC